MKEQKMKNLSSQINFGDDPEFEYKTTNQEKGVYEEVNESTEPG